MKLFCILGQTLISHPLAQLDKKKIRWCYSIFLNESDTKHFFVEVEKVPLIKSFFLHLYSVLNPTEIQKI